MELPVIPFKIPELALPFDIPVLMHPPVDHIAIALPLVVLLLEIVNLIAKKRAIGVTSFFLLLLAIIAAVAAYYTGSTDGKEAFDMLNQAGQTDLKAHKLMGTYLVFASMIVLIFKLLSVMIKRGVVKGLYFLILILFVAGILKQGKEGGELVYKYGANVERVAEMDSTIFDLKEELDELKSAGEAKKMPAAVAKTAEETKTEETVATEKKADELKPKESAAEEKTAEVVKEAEKTVEAAPHEETKAAEKSEVSAPEEKTAEAKEIPEHPAAETHTEEKTPASETAGTH